MKGLTGSTLFSMLLHGSLLALLFMTAPFSVKMPGSRAIDFNFQNFSVSTHKANMVRPVSSEAVAPSPARNKSITKKSDPVPLPREKSVPVQKTEPIKKIIHKNIKKAPKTISKKIVSPQPETIKSDKIDKPLPEEKTIAAANIPHENSRVVQQVSNADVKNAVRPSTAVETSQDITKKAAPSGILREEDAGKHYVRANFSLIQNNIQQTLRYPVIARRKGWEGKVVVSFIVREDGRVTDMRVVESSGFSVLDKNAMSTIKQAAPFPKAPVRAELTVPVIYRLS